MWSHLLVRFCTEKDQTMARERAAVLRGIDTGDIPEQSGSVRKERAEKKKDYLNYHSEAA